MNDEQATKNALMLGKLINNLHSLEFILRAVLFRANPKNANKELPTIYHLKADDIVDEDEYTNFWTLSTIIDKYNSLDVVKNNGGLVIKEDVVKLRDALAHGRVSGKSLDGPMHIMKFSRSLSGLLTGKVKVEFSEEMNERWMDEKIKLIYKELEKGKKISDILNQ